MCPILKAEHRLRLLNYENNFISSIQNLDDLPNLVFLDFYNNRITKISGLASTPTLRVLMLGKNSISKIENVEALANLDVIDLHSNRIRRIENLTGLRTLRVLNLAGNDIEVLRGLESLVSLTELNLRRNRLHSLKDDAVTESLPKSLCRIFLSHNALKTLSSLDPLLPLHNLQELALDGNPLTENTFYRQHMLDNYESLVVLDAKRITPDERRMFAAIRLIREGQKSSSARTTDVTTTTTATISGSGSASYTGVQEGSSTRGRLVGVAPSAQERDESIQIARELWFRYRGKSTMDLSHGTYHEQLARKTALAIYGPCVGVLLRDRFSSITTLTLQFVSFAEISPFVRRMLELPSLRQLRLSDNDLFSFYELDALSTLPLTQLVIENNPVRDLPFFDEYAVFRLPSLNKLNEVAVLDSLRKQATLLFGPLKNLWKTPTIRRIKGFCAPRLNYDIADSPPETNEPKHQLIDMIDDDLFSHDTVAAAAASADKFPLVHAAYRRIADIVAGSCQKIGLVEQEWPQLVHSCVCDEITPNPSLNSSSSSSLLFSSSPV